MPKRAATIITASLFALFHIVVVVIPVVSSGAIGEGQAGLVMLFDMPLVLLLSVTPGGAWVLYNDMTAYTLVFCVIGTLMYAVVGVLIGWVIDIIRTGKRGV